MTQLNFTNEDSVEKFAVVGDWHQNRPYAVACLNNIAEHNSNVKIIVHLGDFLGYGSVNLREKYLDRLQEVCEENDQVIAFIDGNHEDFNYLFNLPVEDNGTVKLRDRIFYLPRSFKWSWNDVDFMALGGAPSINRLDLVPHVSWFPEEIITAGDYEKALNKGNVDVLFTHDCPTGVDIPGLDNNNLPPKWKKEILHCETQRQRLYNFCEEVKPHYLFHGHYHKDYRSVLEYPSEIFDENFNTYTEIIGKDCDGGEFEKNYSIVDVEDLRYRILL